jgi:hypothetical protein
MFDLLNEPRISLTELAKREGVNCCTVWRWAGRGVRSIRLETFSRGGRRFTTLSAFDRFCQRITVATQGEKLPASQSSRSREKQIERAEHEAANLGV